KAKAKAKAPFTACYAHGLSQSSRLLNSRNIIALNFFRQSFQHDATFPHGQRQGAIGQPLYDGRNSASRFPQKVAYGFKVTAILLRLIKPERRTAGQGHVA
ncbi:hypothetical protein, partial [Acetobacter tropicalis]|uniref:hypothetical protein n=1 Tax=Acetobacter tropicalis TaxID=104102 RepID=UPI001EE66B37